MVEPARDGLKRRDPSAKRHAAAATETRRRAATAAPSRRTAGARADADAATPGGAARGKIPSEQGIRPASGLELWGVARVLAPARGSDMW